MDNLEATQQARREALREAVLDGIADMDAGRFCSFESPAALGRHLTAIATKAIGTKRAVRDEKR